MLPRLRLGVWVSHQQPVNWASQKSSECSVCCVLAANPHSNTGVGSNATPSRPGRTTVPASLVPPSRIPRCALDDWKIKAFLPRRPFEKPWALPMPRWPSDMHLAPLMVIKTFFVDPLENYAAASCRQTTPSPRLTVAPAISLTQTPISPSSLPLPRTAGGFS